MLPPLAQRLAADLTIREQQASATIRLLDEGATVPFIARYRKEATGGLDDTQLRHLDERLTYLRELDERRTTILASLTQQEKLTPALQSAIEVATDKTTLEDLYLPYKPKRRTKAQIAKEAGLDPLAQQLLLHPESDPEQTALPYVNPESGVQDSKAALDGARAILIEHFGESAELLAILRETLWKTGYLTANVQSEKEQEGQKFSDYFHYDALLSTTPSHRALALLRGRQEGVLRLAIRYQPSETPTHVHSDYEDKIAAYFAICQQGRPADQWLLDTVRLTWRAKLFPSLENELITRLKEQADSEAIRVFATNLHDLLLAAPAGERVTLGLDPGLRTGVKVAVIDTTGKLLETATIYPHEPRRDWDRSIAQLATLCQRHSVALVAIGNGTASRETDKLVQALMQRHPELALEKMVVSEAGASVYSASERAAKEFPDLDVSLRGAVSIARRLQDPLAELVKIDPKAIGVGQYQHDVNQSQLNRALTGVVEDCVNAVGVDVNTASAALLSYISGLNATLAQHIVTYRDENGAFKNRRALLKVPRLGEKTFELCAGFLRIQGGDNPLDASSVHPEAYPVVEKMSQKTGQRVTDLLHNSNQIKLLRPQDYVDERFGLPTVLDILKELEKPGRDPRPEFKTATFTEGIQDIKDLVPGLVLEGVITNVTNFGAFVDIGVHQDGLVHISALSDRFVSDPRQIVKAGDIVTVTVQEVDLPRRRISLSMRHDAVTAPSTPKKANVHPPGKTSKTTTVPNTALAAAFAKLRQS